MSIKKIVFSIVLVIIIVSLSFFMLKGNKVSEESDGRISLVASNFATYDFLRAIVGNSDNAKLELLLGPGKDAHSYEPTAQDLIKIQNSDMFVYIGGESENWAEKVMESLNTKNTKVVKISDFVDKIQEQDVDGAEDNDERNNSTLKQSQSTENDSERQLIDEQENSHQTNGSFDDHIWTSPANAIKMVKTLEVELERIDEKNSENYKNNSENYINQIIEVDREIKQIVDSKSRDRLVFGDRMPMQYFIDYYNLKVSAAFSGCSTEIEPSASTIAYLESIVKQDKIPVVLYIELNNGRVANTIANETNAKALKIQTLHNVSLEDFNNGETWVSLMRKNESVLKEALQ